MTDMPGTPIPPFLEFNMRLSMEGFPLSDEKGQAVAVAKQSTREVAANQLRPTHVILEQVVGEGTYTFRTDFSLLLISSQSLIAELGRFFDSVEVIREQPEEPEEPPHKQAEPSVWFLFGGAAGVIAWLSLKKVHAQGEYGGN
jgi:hypothetical protein